MVTVLVVYCLTLNPTMCRTLEIAPVDHETVSVAECIKGGANYAATTFRLDYADWTVKGWKCREVPNPMTVWLDHREP
jgi:hypothetical protein